MRRNKPRTGKRPANASASSTATNPKKPGASRAPSHARRQRWFYDVRQYALITDTTGHVLLLQLPKTYDEDAANSWTLPGGKLEPDDEPTPGILREITEETGLKAKLSGPCSIKRWTTRNSKKLAIFYLAKVDSEKPKPNLSSEHQRAVWIKPEELKDFPFHREDMKTVLEEHLGSPAK